MPGAPSFYSPKATVMLVAPEDTLKRLVENPPASKSGPVIDRVRNVPAGDDLYVLVDLASLRPLIQMGLAQAQRQIPPDARPFIEGVNLISAAELTVNLSQAAPTSLVVHANDEDAAKQIEVLLDQGIEKAREQMKADLARQAASEDPVERALAQYMERVSGEWAKPFMPKRDGAKLTFLRIEGTNSPQQQLTNAAVIGFLVALLLPAVQAAREAARRNQSMNNLKQLIIALLNYHDTRKSFPPNAIYSADGKPLLSWRVAMLPFIEEQALYAQFHLDEPWDSEHNRALIARMPQAYENPNLHTEKGKTNYLAIVGKDCIFDGTAKGAGIRQITDGTSKTIMLVEADADKAVEWTKPDDLKYDENNPAAGLGHVRPGGWLAAYADGHIQFISNDTDPNILKLLFTKSDGQPVELP
jgi:hypothetical protein